MNEGRFLSVVVFAPNRNRLIQLLTEESHLDMFVPFNRIQVRDIIASQIQNQFECLQEPKPHFCP